MVVVLPTPEPDRQLVEGRDQASCFRRVVGRGAWQESLVAKRRLSLGKTRVRMTADPVERALWNTPSPLRYLQQDHGKSVTTAEMLHTQPGVARPRACAAVVGGHWHPYGIPAATPILVMPVYSCRERWHNHECSRFSLAGLSGSISPMRKSPYSAPLGSRRRLGRSRKPGMRPKAWAWWSWDRVSSWLSRRLLTSLEPYAQVPLVDTYKSTSVVHVMI